MSFSPTIQPTTLYSTAVKIFSSQNPETASSSARSLGKKWHLNCLDLVDGISSLLSPNNIHTCSTCGCHSGAGYPLEAAPIIGYWRTVAVPVSNGNTSTIPALVTEH